MAGVTARRALGLRARVLRTGPGVRVQRLWLRLKHLGYARYCPVCRSHVRAFLPHGAIRRENSVCPVCQARERHRLAWLWMTRELRLPARGGRFLHLAPEPELARRLKALPNLVYVSGDLVHRASVRMDIGRLPLPDASFDLVYCSHVLNMLPDDRAAFGELARVLRPGGLAVLQVPAPLAGPGVEAGPAATPQERLALFADPAMYRHYGRQDLLDRLAAAGLACEPRGYFREFSPGEQVFLGLQDEDLFLCRKSP